MNVKNKSIAFNCISYLNEKIFEYIKYDKTHKSVKCVYWACICLIIKTGLSWDTGPDYPFISDSYDEIIYLIR